MSDDVLFDADAQGAHLSCPPAFLDLPGRLEEALRSETSPIAILAPSPPSQGILELDIGTYAAPPKSAQPMSHGSTRRPSRIQSHELVGSIYQPLEPLPYDWTGPPPPPTGTSSTSASTSLSSSASSSLPTAQTTHSRNRALTASSHSSTLPGLSPTSSLPSPTSSVSALHSPTEPFRFAGAVEGASSSLPRKLDVPTGPYLEHGNDVRHSQQQAQAGFDSRASLSLGGLSSDPTLPSLAGRRQARPAALYHTRRPSRLSITVPPSAVDPMFGAAASQNEVDNLMRNVDKNLALETPGGRMSPPIDLDNAVVPPSLPLDPALTGQPVEIAGMMLSSEDLSLLRSDIGPVAPRSAPAWQTSFNPNSSTSRQEGGLLPAPQLHFPQYPSYSNNAAAPQAASMPIPQSFDRARVSPPPAQHQLSRSQSPSKAEAQAHRHHPYSPPQVLRRLSSVEGTDLLRMREGGPPRTAYGSPSSAYQGPPPGSSSYTWHERSPSQTGFPMSSREHTTPRSYRDVIPRSTQYYGQYSPMDMDDLYLQHPYYPSGFVGQQHPHPHHHAAYAAQPRSPSARHGSAPPPKSPTGKGSGAPAIRKSRATQNAIQSGGTMFVNYSTNDSQKLMGGVAPSGSSRKRQAEEAAAAAAAAAASAASTASASNTTASAASPGTTSTA